jgi:hypothetical protein
MELTNKYILALLTGSETDATENKLDIINAKVIDTIQTMFDMVDNREWTTLYTYIKEDRHQAREFWLYLQDKGIETTYSEDHYDVYCSLRSCVLDIKNVLYVHDKLVQYSRDYGVDDFPAYLLSIILATGQDVTLPLRYTDVIQAIHPQLGIHDDGLPLLMDDMGSIVISAEEVDEILNGAWRVHNDAMKAAMDNIRDLFECTYCETR